MGGMEAVKEKDDRCEEPSRWPESICIECHPEMRRFSASFGWCKEHGVAICLVGTPWNWPSLTLAPKITAGRPGTCGAMGSGLCRRTEPREQHRLPTPRKTHPTSPRQRSRRNVALKRASPVEIGQMRKRASDVQYVISCTTRPGSLRLSGAHSRAASGACENRCGRP